MHGRRKSWRKLVRKNFQQSKGVLTDKILQGRCLWVFKSLSKSYAIVCNLVKGDSHILIRFSKVWTQVLGKLSPQFLRIRLSVFKLRDLVSKILSNIVSKVQNLCKQQVL